MADSDIPRTYDEYLTARPEGTFTAWLRERAAPHFTEAASHSFTRKLGDDTLDEVAFEHYLVQDYAFVEGWIGTLGHAIGQAPTMEAKSRIVDLLSQLTGTEHDYFERTFDRLGVPSDEWTDVTPSPAIRSFLEHMTSGALVGSYEETLALILAEEWIYLTWARKVVDRSESRRPHYYEWIQHHTDPWLEDWVAWIRTELDRGGPDLSPRAQARAGDLFERTAILEAMLFDESLGANGAN